MNWLIGWKGHAVVAIGSALFAGWAAWQWQANVYSTQIATMKAKHAEAVAKAEQDARAEGERRVAKQTEITNEAIQQAESARADARASDAAGRELRARVTALVNANRRPDDSATVSGGSAADNLTRVLAELLGEVDQHAGKLAEQADAARIAGQACERSYDALTVGGAFPR